MKKRFLGLILCLALLLPFAAPAARAGETIFFTAMGESILPLRDETMPFLSGTALYIPPAFLPARCEKLWTCPAAAASAGGRSFSTAADTPFGLT